MTPADLERLKHFAIRGAADHSDDLERARSAFRNCPPETMAKEYGSSGKTRQQILDEYQRARERANADIEWIKRLQL